MAWANGGGFTHEVATSPEGAGLGDFEWRISVAEVSESGAFSTFHGVDRVLVLLDGEGMTLTIDGVATPAPRHQPVRFAGESTTSCALHSGPTTDLNVMVRRGACEARVRILDSDVIDCAPVDGERAMLIVLDGWRTVGALATPPTPLVTPLGPLDCLEVGEPLRLNGTGAVALLALRATAPA
jgi:environmental stress-induced protein Ves